MQDDTKLKKKRKIGFFITKGAFGGAGKYVFSLATSISKDDFDIFVVTGEGNALKEKIESAGIKTYVIKSMKRDMSIFSEILSLLSLFRIVLKERPDILHLNSPKASGLGSLVGRILFVPHILQTVHGFTWNEERGPISKTLIVFFTWLTIVFCHKTIVLSKREERQATSLPFIKNKIVLIPNGIEKTEYMDRMIARKEILSMVGGEASDSTFIVGTLAELHRNKGLEYAIQAVSKINKEFLYFIIGEGEERENLKKIIKDLGLENKVFLLGFMENANQYLKAFDVFLLTSIKEGLPYVVLEAGYASLPVISSSIGGIPEVIKNNESGILVTPKKVGEIVNSIQFLMDNPEKQKLFGENIHKKIENEFTFETMLRKTTSLYIES